MLKIRLQRIGRVHEPSFRLVLTESKNSTKSGRAKEILGSYDPRRSRDLLRADRIKYWLSQGANFTPIVNNLLLKHQITRGKKIDVSSVSKKTSTEAVTEKEAPKEAPAEKVIPASSDTMEQTGAEGTA